MTQTYNPAPPVKNDSYYWVVNRRGERLAHFNTRSEAYALANTSGQATAIFDADGRIELTGDDPLINQVLGRVHCMAPFRECLRAVVALWGDKQDRQDYMDFGRGQRGVPGWKKYRSLPRSHRHVLMTQIILIHRQHQQTYIDVMGGRF